MKPPPRAEILYPLPNVTASSTATFFFRETYDLSSTTCTRSCGSCGRRTFWCAIDGHPESICDPARGVTFTGLPDGKHNFSVSIEDGIGKRGKPSTYRWAVNSSMPDLLLSNLQRSNSSGSSNPDVRFAISTKTNSSIDPAPGCANCTYRCILNNQTLPSCPSATRITLGNAREGLNVFRVEAQLGGISLISSQLLWMQDTVAPVPLITSGPPKVTNKQEAVFDFVATDQSPSGIEVACYDCTFNCRLKIEDRGAIIQSNCSVPASHTGLGTPGKAVYHEFSVWAVDAAGNNATAPSNWSWVINLEAPRIVTLVEPPSITRSSTYTLSLELKKGTGTDGCKGCTATCSLDGGAPANCLPSPSPANVSFYNLKAGWHTVQIRATDDLGNLQILQRSWEIHATPPSVDLVWGNITNLGVLPMDIYLGEDCKTGPGLRCQDLTECNMTITGSLSTRAVNSSFLRLTSLHVSMELQPYANGPLMVSVPDGFCYDVVGNPSAARARTYEYNATPAQAIIWTSVKMVNSTAQGAEPGGPRRLTNKAPIQFFVGFTNAVTSFDVGAVAVTNGTWVNSHLIADWPLNVYNSSFEMPYQLLAVYVVNVAALCDCTISAKVLKNAARNELGIGSKESTMTVSVVYDSTPPQPSLSLISSFPIGRHEIELMFDEPLTTALDVKNLNVKGAFVSSFSGSAMQFTVILTEFNHSSDSSSSQEELWIEVPEGVVQDEAGNRNRPADLYLQATRKPSAMLAPPQPPVIISSLSPPQPKSRVEPSEVGYILNLATSGIMFAHAAGQIFSMLSGSMSSLPKSFAAQGPPLQGSISTIQTFALLRKLQARQGTKFYAVADSLAWMNFEKRGTGVLSNGARTSALTHLQVATTTSGHVLADQNATEDPASPTPVRSLGGWRKFWDIIVPMSSFVGASVIFHCMAVAAFRYLRLQPPSALYFPRVEILLLMFVSNAIVQATASLILGGVMECMVAGILMLVTTHGGAVLAFSYLLLTCVGPGRGATYVERVLHHRRPTSGKASSLELLFALALGRKSCGGAWVENPPSRIVRRYGVLFECIRGEPEKFNRTRAAMSGARRRRRGAGGGGKVARGQGSLEEETGGEGNDNALGKSGGPPDWKRPRKDGSWVEEGQGGSGDRKEGAKNGDETMRGQEPERSMLARSMSAALKERVLLSSRLHSGWLLGKMRLLHVSMVLLKQVVFGLIVSEVGGRGGREGARRKAGWLLLVECVFLVWIGVVKPFVSIVAQGLELLGSICLVCTLACVYKLPEDETKIAVVLEEAMLCFQLLSLSTHLTSQWAYVIWSFYTFFRSERPSGRLLTYVVPVHIRPPAKATTSHPCDRAGGQRLPQMRSFKRWASLRDIHAIPDRDRGLSKQSNRRPRGKEPQREIERLGTRVRQVEESINATGSADNALPSAPPQMPTIRGVESSATPAEIRDQKDLVCLPDNVEPLDDAVPPQTGRPTQRTDALPPVSADSCPFLCQAGQNKLLKASVETEPTNSHVRGCPHRVPGSGFVDDDPGDELLSCRTDDVQIEVFKRGATEKDSRELLQDVHKCKDTFPMNGTTPLKKAISFALDLHKEKKSQSRSKESARKIHGADQGPGSTDGNEKTSRPVRTVTFRLDEANSKNKGAGAPRLSRSLEHRPLPQVNPRRPTIVPDATVTPAPQIPRVPATAVRASPSLHISLASLKQKIRSRLRPPTLTPAETPVKDREQKLMRPHENSWQSHLISPHLLDPGSSEPVLRVTSVAFPRGGGAKDDW